MLVDVYNTNSQAHEILVPSGKTPRPIMGKTPTSKARTIDISSIPASECLQLELSEDDNWAVLVKK